MELVAVGGDLRYAHLIDWARREGVDAAGFGLEYSGVDIPHATLADLQTTESVVMHNPFGTAGMGFPYAQKRYEPEAVWEAIPLGTPIFIFGPGKASKPFLERYAIINLSGNENLTLKNAAFTAEGAIHAVSERALFALSDQNAMVVGYGRIGKALTRILLGCGARVTVAARSVQARKSASTVGAKTVDMTQMIQVLPKQRVVFSTPPARIISVNELIHFRQDAMLVDLSSPPYGADIETAKIMGLDAWREPGLPGRYSPESAGRALLEAIREASKGENSHE